MRLAMQSGVRGMTGGEKADASSAICRVIAESKVWQDSDVVLLFAGDDSEPCLDGLIANGVHTGKTVGVPRIDWERKLLLPRAVRSPDDLIEGRHGIRVPHETCGAVEVDRVGLVLVPGVGFDLSGGRLGRGGGFYDRFVTAWRGGCPMGSSVLGVCFDVQLVNRVPVGVHDAGVDGICTESRLTILS